ncbi:MAG TPA: glycosyltransferase, partial [bacterium]|nr:glycosyltransferase [bacterium]
MKILFISHSSVIPTYREKLRLLAQHRNLEITLLLPQFWPEAGKRVQTFNQASNKEGFRIISAPILLEGRVKRHFYPFFSQYIRQVQPDLIHIEEEPYSLVAWQAAQAAAKLGIPLVFFTWENLLEQFSFPHQAIRNWVLQNAAYAIAGDTEAAELLKKAHYPSKKISIIPQYGINPKLFLKKNVTKLKKHLKLDSFTVGYVGRLVQEKGLPDLLEAFARLSSPDSTLLLVGNGPLRQELE